MARDKRKTSRTIPFSELAALARREMDRDFMRAWLTSHDPRYRFAVIEMRFLQEFAGAGHTEEIDVPQSFVRGHMLLDASRRAVEEHQPYRRLLDCAPSDAA